MGWIISPTGYPAHFLCMTQFIDLCPLRWLVTGSYPRLRDFSPEILCLYKGFLRQRVFSESFLQIFSVSTDCLHCLHCLHCLNSLSVSTEIFLYREFSPEIFCLYREFSSQRFSPERFSPENFLSVWLHALSIRPSFLPTFLPSDLPSFLPTFLPSDLPSFRNFLTHRLTSD